MRTRNTPLVVLEQSQQSEDAACVREYLAKYVCEREKIENPGCMEHASMIALWVAVTQVFARLDSLVYHELFGVTAQEVLQKK